MLASLVVQHLALGDGLTRCGSTDSIPLQVEREWWEKNDMCANPKCRVEAIELGRCKRCGEIACYSCGYKTVRAVWHDGAFCQQAEVEHETSVDSELRRNR